MNIKSINKIFGVFLIIVILFSGCAKQQKDATRIQSIYETSKENSSTQPNEIITTEFETITAEKPDMIVEDRQFTYYYNKDGLYRKSKTNSSKVCLIPIDKESSFKDIWIDGEWLYYMIMTAADDGISWPITAYRVRTNGQENTKLFSNKSLEKLDVNPYSGGLHFVWVSKDKVLFSMSYDFYLYDVNATLLTAVAYGTRYYETTNKKIYYTDHYSISELDLSTFQAKQLLGKYSGFANETDESSISNFYYGLKVINDKLFYTQRKPQGLYQYNGGNGKDILIDGSKKDGYEYCAYRGKLYYIAGAEENTLQEYNPELEQSKIVREINDYGGNLGIENGYVTYQKKGVGETVCFSLEP